MHLPERLAYRADPGSYTSGWNLGRGDLLVPFDLFSASLLFALPWPVVGAALGARSADHPTRAGRVGPAPPDRDRRTARRRPRLGVTMRAELANVDERGERRRFVLDCTASALRLGLHGVMWIVACAAGLAAVGTNAASRASLADDAPGSSWSRHPGSLSSCSSRPLRSHCHRSFRDGLQGGSLVLLAALVASYAVGVSEAVVWAERRAGYLTTDDAVRPSAQAAVLDLLRPELSMLLAAAMGALVARRRAHDPQPAREVSVSPSPSLAASPSR